MQQLAIAAGIALFGHIPITGIKNPEQATENYEALSVKLQLGGLTRIRAVLATSPLILPFGYPDAGTKHFRRTKNLRRSERPATIAEQVLKMGKNKNILPFRIQKWAFRLILLLAIALLYLGGQQFLFSPEQTHTRPRTIDFELPLPAELAQKYQIQRNPDIEKVIISGFFSSWDPDNEYFRMDKQKPGQWSIRIHLPPGDNQYKFVLHLKNREKPVWVYDQNNPERVGDSFGGYNSVLAIPDYERLELIFTILCAGLGIFLLLYYILEPLVHWLMGFHLPFRYKLVSTMVFVGIMSNIVFIGYNFLESRHLIQQSSIDSINMVHLFLEREGINLEKLDNPETRTNIHQALQSFLGETRTGTELKRILVFNFLLLVILAFLSFLILTNVGKVITGYLEELTTWTKRIIQGDFDMEKQINTGDEIEQLSENFNTMRLSLQKSFVEIEQRNHRLRNIAYRDNLTDRPNREKLLVDLKQNPPFALLLFNINSFRSINDYFGTEVGDIVLQELSRRLGSMCLEQSRRLYKTDADEFAVTIAETMGAEELDILAGQLCDRAMEDPYCHRENEIYISVTSGISMTEEGYTFYNPGELLVKAEIALRNAKTHMLRHMIYNFNMEISRAYEYNMQWTKKLKSAIEEERLVPFFQPIIDNKTRKVEKYECLVRLLETNGSIISPASFLEVSKQARFYRFITRRMVEKSIEAFKGRDMEFSINLALEDMLDPKTVAFLLDQLDANPREAKHMIIEIVETAEIVNYDLIKQFIAMIKRYGCRIAVDDFGAGYSNFDHLLKLNIDYIKIDGSLIKNLDSDSNSQVIVRTIARFARELDIKVIAEWVHNESVLDKIIEYDIDYSQGYLFGAPQQKLST